MSESIALNRGWKVGWSEHSWEGADPSLAARATIDAEVPGDVHLDLMRAGLLPDLYVGMNLDHTRWTERKDWWYRCEFPTPAARGDRTAILVFRGLDTFATVWLNGQLVGRTANMFIRHEFDVSNLLVAEGCNRLVVWLAAPAFAIPVDARHNPPMTCSPERLFCRKAQMSFGWHIAPRLVTTGIWRPVELVLVDQARITNVGVEPLEFLGGGAKVRVTVEIQWTGGASGSVRISGRVSEASWSATAAMVPGRNVVAAEICLRDAPLWWPIGYGRPSLIQTQAMVEVENRCVDTHSGQTGLRRIELVREPQPGGAESWRKSKSLFSDRDALVVRTAGEGTCLYFAWDVGGGYLGAARRRTRLLVGHALAQTPVPRFSVAAPLWLVATGWRQAGERTVFHLLQAQGSPARFAESTHYTVLEDDEKSRRRSTHARTS